MKKKVCIIVVGCNYQNSGISLNGCINDAMDVSQTFVNLCEKYDFSPELHLLLDNNNQNYPSKERILNILVSTINECNKNTFDNVIFYFAGHGYQNTDKNGDELDGKDENILSGDQLFIRDDELKNIISKLNNKKVGLSFIFDCCHSGTILDLPKIVIGSQQNNVSKNIINNKKILCICACDDSESSIERDGRGLFTKMFCRLIRNKGVNQPIYPILKNITDFFSNGDDKMSLTVSCSKNVILRKSNLFNIKGTK